MATPIIPWIGGKRRLAARVVEMVWVRLPQVIAGASAATSPSRAPRSRLESRSSRRVFPLRQFLFSLRNCFRA